MTLKGWTWAAARCRGVSHERASVRIQDAFTCIAPRAPSHPIAVVVSDGAGSASHGGQGASLICRTIALHVRRHFAAVTSLPDEERLESWVDAVRDQISAVASRRQLLPRDFAATLVFVVSDGTDSLTLHVGDGCAVVRDVERSTWTALTWPDHGEYASTTCFVTDQPNARIRIARHKGEISAVAVFSDGLERLVLDLRSKQPHSPFFDGMIAPVASSLSMGKDRELSRKLITFLNSDHVNNRTDDDKTLVLAARR
jgi:Protein phosphatase 2C